MKVNLLSEMLLIQEPSIFRLYQEIIDICTWFVAPVFTLALLIEFLGEMNFGDVVRRLFIVVIFMSYFYQFHTKAVELSLNSATETLRKVSPRNLFVKKWSERKVRTKSNESWNFIQSIVIPDLNDLLGTAFFLLAKVFIWLLKLIYSSVYHLTYVFSGVTAVLYFLGWTKDALKGTIQSSLWCLILPFVIVAILTLVGNSIEEKALGSDLAIADINTIIWLFGVTLLLLISPLITFAMVKGEGIHSFGAKMGQMVVSSGMKGLAVAGGMAKIQERFRQNFSGGQRFNQQNNKSSHEIKSSDSSSRERPQGQNRSLSPQKEVIQGNHQFGLEKESAKGETRSHSSSSVPKVTIRENKSSTATNKASSPSNASPAQNKFKKVEGQKEGNKSHPSTTLREKSQVSPPSAPNPTFQKQVEVRSQPPITEKINGAKKSELVKPNNKTQPRRGGHELR